MELKTKRLVLKELSLPNLNEVHELHSLPEVDEFNTLGIPESIGTTETLLKEWLAITQRHCRNEVPGFFKALSQLIASCATMDDRFLFGHYARRPEQG